MIKLKKKIYELKTSPSKPLNSDLYLVEFPKSGITWFSTILAMLYFIRDGRGKLPTYFNLEQIIGDIHQTRNIQVPPVYPYHRTIKSHATFNANYRNVVYILRNPFSVMESYYNYVTVNNTFRGSFDDFVKDPALGIDAWCNHVNSWVFPEKQQNFQIIKYEQLKICPIDSLSDLLKSIGLVFSEQEIKRAIEYAAFDRMRADDDLYKKLNPNRNYSFVRSGKLRAEMNEATRELITARAERLIEKLYPEYL